MSEYTPYMQSKVVARGSKTRQTNKQVRRQRILDIARNQIAENGFESFTIKNLASEAGVTIPTIHNLFGKKVDIFHELCSEMVERTDQIIFSAEITNPIDAIVSFTDNLLELYRKDEAFYRAAFVAGERIGLFEHESPTGLYQSSLRIAQDLCQQAKDNGYLEGKVATKQLAQHLFNCQRIARLDWVSRYISLQQYRTQVLTGMSLVYMADATPAFKKELLSLIRSQ